MSRIHLLILWVLALVAGLIVFSTQGNSRAALASETTLEPGDTPITTADLRGYGGLKFADEKNVTTLLNKDDAWLVVENKDYPVNLQTLARAFDAVRELKIIQGLPAEQKHWARFGLDPEAENEADRPRELSLLSKDGTVAQTIFIGKARETSGGQGRASGRFIRLAGDDSGVYIVQESFSQLNADPLTWIDKSLPKVEGILSITMKPDNKLLTPWTVTRPTAVGEFTLDGIAQDQETVASAVAPLKNLFASASFTELLTKEDVLKRAALDETREITIKTASGISYLFTIVPEKRDPPKDEKKDAEKPDDRNYIVSFKLLSGPSDPEKPTEDSSDADKAGYYALVANQKMAERRYQEQQALQGRHFLVNNFVVNGLLKPRHKMHKTKADPAAPAASSAAPSAPSAPRTGTPPPGFPSATATPPNQPKRTRLQAVTKPIAIPQIPKKSEPAETPEAEE